MPISKSLVPLVKSYFEKDPQSAAHVLETLSESEAGDVLKSLPPHLAAGAVVKLNDHFSSAVLKNLSPDAFSAIVSKMPPQQALTVFLSLPEENRENFLSYLDPKKKKEMHELLTFPVDSAGRLMSTQLISFHTDLKVKDAIRKIREASQKGFPASYVYMVDQENRLVGVLNMRDLLVAQEGQTLGDVMRTGVFAVDAFMDREKVANELSSRHFFAAPVVDNEGRLLGVVKAEQLIEEIKEEATEDLQRMFGVGSDEKAFSPIGYALKKRLPWLHINLATAFLAAGVVALFEDIIARISILAVFLPVVAGQGGNAGGQSLAVVMRGLVMREIPQSKAKNLIWKEARIGAINGIIIGVVTALIAWLWHGNAYLGLVIGLGMLVSLAVAGLSGAAIPIIMRAIGLDPAQCSNIILTTITDVMGFFSFLGFAVLFQDKLI